MFNHFRYRNFYLVLIFLIENLYYKCDNDYDAATEKMDTKLSLYIYGYNNEKNKGLNKGCCNVRIDDICLPCQYTLTATIKRKNRFETTSIYVSYDTYKYTIGKFSQAATMLFENFFFERITSYYDDSDYNVDVYGPLSTTSPVDNYKKFQYDNYGIFKYDGVYGYNNNIKLWYMFQLEDSSHSIYVRYTFFFNSIYFKNFILPERKQCCSPLGGQSGEYCPIPCDFKMYIRFSDSYRVNLESKKVQNNTFYYYYGDFFILKSFYYFNQDNKFITRVHSDANNLQIDEFILGPIIFYHGLHKTFNNVIGVYGNAVINATLSALCSQNGGENCKYPCIALKGTEFCDDGGKLKCLNLAFFKRSCSQTSLSCNPNPCQHDGLCSVKTNHIYCSCKDGYKGRYCEVPDCAFDCNNRGICLDSNYCSCHFPYTGPSCKEQLCDDIEESKCKNGENCKIINGAAICVYSDQNFTGYAGDEPRCFPRCVFGSCQFISSEKSSKCVCSNGYNGEACDVQIQGLNRSKKHINLGWVILVLVIFEVILIFAFVFLKIKQRNKPIITTSTTQA